MTLMLREGGYYKDRGGNVWGPIRRNSYSKSPYIWEGNNVRRMCATWYPSGVVQLDRTSNYDLVSECSANGSPLPSHNADGSDIYDEAYLINKEFQDLNLALAGAMSTYKKLQEENIKLKAELEALKPKPVTTSSRTVILRTDLADGVYIVFLEDS